MIYEEQNYYNIPVANQRNWSEREGVRGVRVSDNQVEQMKFRHKPRLEKKAVCEHYA